MTTVDVLFSGYIGDRVAGTVSVIRATDFVAIVDPGMVPDRDAILSPLRSLGLEPEDVTDVILSHHHPDHTMNIALFPERPVHDYWAVYERDLWTARPADGVELADGVTLLETPGHTPQDITTLVDTGEETVALTHLWWSAEAQRDPLASDPVRLVESRKRVLEVATLIVPGHGAPFRASEARTEAD